MNMIDISHAINLWALKNPIWFNGIIIAISLGIIIKAADYLVSGVTGYAEKLGKNHIFSY